MMTRQAQLFIVIFLLFVLAVIINMIKRRQLELKYVLLWMGCDIALMILTCAPDLMNVLARMLGIQSPVNMIFFLGFLFSLMIIFSLTVTISRITAKVRKMAQEIAFLSEQLDEEISKRENY